MALPKQPNETQEEFNLRIEETITSPLGAVTSDVFEPSVDLATETPEEPLVPSIEDLNATLVETAPEEKVSTLTERLQELNLGLVGETAFRVAEEEEQEVTELRKAQQDLSAQLKILIAESKAIPIRLQQEAEGRGITVGGLAPIQRGQLRENAIKALTVSSLLEATRGNLSLALDLVDRAVATKFDPIRAEITALTRNLNLIIRSPEYSLADKRRAQIQKGIQAKRTKELRAEEERLRLILNTAIEAARAGADAVTLRNIQNASDPVEAARLAEPFLREEEKAIEPRKGTGNYTNESGESITDIEAGRLLVEANSDLSDAELKLALSENVPELSVTNINSIIVTRTKEPPTVEEIKQKIIDTLERQKDVFSRSEAKTAAENQLKSALGIKKGQVLPDAFKDAIEDALVVVYGRTFFQKIFPGGR